MKHFESLEVENMRNIKQLKVDFDGSIRTYNVTGNNGAGKTSFIDALWYALQGSKHLRQKRGNTFPLGEVVQKGADSMKVAVILSGDEDSWEIERVMDSTGKQRSISIKSALGKSIKQSDIDNIVNRIFPDPMRFANMTPAEQLEELAVFVPNISKFDADIEMLQKEKKPFDESQSHLANMIKKLEVEADELRAQHESLERIDLRSIADEAEKAAAVRNTYKHSKEKLQAQRAVIQQMKSNIDFLEGQVQEKHNTIQQLQKEIDALILNKRSESERLIDENRLLREIEIASLKEPDVPSSEVFAKRLQEAEKFNERLQVIEQLQDKKDERNSVAESIKDYKERINAVKKRKAEAFDKIPIPNATFDSENGIVISGRALHQMSTGQQLRIGLSIAKALINKFDSLRVISMTHGSMLDHDAFEKIKKFSDENDIQVFIESVTDIGIEGVETFRIREGMVSEQS